MKVGEQLIDIFTETIDNVGQSIGSAGDLKEVAAAAARTQVNLAKERQRFELERAAQNQKLIQNSVYILLMLLVVAAGITLYQKNS